MGKNPHGGNLEQYAKISGVPKHAILDCSVNVNPLGMPPGLQEHLICALQSITQYPAEHPTVLQQAVAQRFAFSGLSANNIVCARGSTELLYALPAILQQMGARRAVIPVPCYRDYGLAAQHSNLPVHWVPLQECNGFVANLQELGQIVQPGDIVFLGNPGNPAGSYCPKQALVTFVQSMPTHSWLLLDEAFAGFIPGWPHEVSLLDTVQHSASVLVLQSLTKLFAIPGLRLGVGFLPENIAQKFRQRQQPWYLGAMELAAGMYIMQQDLVWSFLEESRQFVAQRNQELRTALANEQGRPILHVVSGSADYLLCKIPPECMRTGVKAPKLQKELLQRYAVAVRDCSEYAGLSDEYIRIAVGTQVQNNRLVLALSECLGVPLSIESMALTKPTMPTLGIRPKGKARSVMIQGLSSDAGKSVVTAGLCRLLKNMGYKVAPFKAQNMALNSAVTASGKEIGRAQALQAEACGIEPDERMNPILLKPLGNRSSQVIVMGQSQGIMNVQQYHAFKAKAWEVVKQAYDSLCQEYDFIVLEGAGSPAEINLKQGDIVNMRMAQYAQSKVLLVGDIDRGGVFASFLGTYQTFTPAEKQLVAGFVVNKFRGDASLLQSAFDYVQQQTGVATVATIPYFQDMQLPQEDSVSWKSGNTGHKNTTPLVDIVVIDVPSISNFTDMDALYTDSLVQVRKVKQAHDFGAPHGVILPGSRTVMGDLQWLRTQGLDTKILEYWAAGGFVLGICGGLQMLGTHIEDEFGVDQSHNPDQQSTHVVEQCQGLGILPLYTRMMPQKELRQVSCVHSPSGAVLQGYEIHHGVSVATNPSIVKEWGFTLNTVTATYVHGILDSGVFRSWWYSTICEEYANAYKSQKIELCKDLDNNIALNNLAKNMKKAFFPETLQMLFDLPSF
jgi:adenosylcobyric acid synthase